MIFESWLDWVILGILGLSALVSLLRGFVREALSLSNWVIAFVVATQFRLHLATLLESVIQTELFRHIAAFGILFIASLIVGALITGLLASLVRRAGLGPTDRILGIIFGALRGAIIITAIVLVLRLTPLVHQAFWKDSLLVPFFERLAVWTQMTLGWPVDRKAPDLGGRT